MALFAVWPGQPPPRFAPPNNPVKFSTWLAFASLCLLSGSGWLLAEWRPETLPGLLPVALRSGLLAGIFWALDRGTNRSGRHGLTAGTQLRLFASSVLVAALPTVLVARAGEYLSPWTETLVFALTPALVVFFASQAAAGVRRAGKPSPSARAGTRGSRRSGASSPLQSPVVGYRSSLAHGSARHGRRVRLGCHPPAPAADRRPCSARSDDLLHIDRSIVSSAQLRSSQKQLLMERPCTAIGTPAQPSVGSPSHTAHRLALARAFARRLFLPLPAGDRHHHP